MASIGVVANELLDFVISLVRDHDAAARYAADPDAALAAANLAGVTSADVDNLLPMVSDSVAMATPQFGAAPATAAAEWDSTVWTSGAATAALDAFTPPHVVATEPAPAIFETLPEQVPAMAPSGDVDALPQVIGDPAAAVEDGSGWTDWEHPVDSGHGTDVLHDAPAAHDGNFDILS